MLPIKERLLLKISIDEVTTCWNWTGTFRESPGTKRKNRGNYGVIVISGKRRAVHRVSYEEYKGPIGDLCVLHKCDNPSCINPEHLFLGTNQDNVRDMLNKGRVKPPEGEKHWKSKTVTSQVQEIRDLYNSGVTQKALGAQFGVTQQQISKIVLGLRRVKS